MQAALSALVTCTPAGDRFTIMVLAVPDQRVRFSMSLKYCPFCGTRIDPDWVKNFQSGYALSRSVG
jgi:hypothetical protein